MCLSAAAALLFLEIVEFCSLSLFTLESETESCLSRCIRSSLVCYSCSVLSLRDEWLFPARMRESSLYGEGRSCTPRGTLFRWQPVLSEGQIKISLCLLQTTFTCSIYPSANGESSFNKRTLGGNKECGSVL